MLFVVDAVEPKMLPADCAVWPLIEPPPNMLPTVPAAVPVALDPNPDPNVLLLLPPPKMLDAVGLAPTDPIEANGLDEVFDGLVVLLSC